MSKALATVALAAALLAACASPEGASNEAVADASNAAANAAPPAANVAPPIAPAPAAATPALAVDGEGLRLFDRDTGAARPIAFGTPQAQTLAALAFRGPPGTGTNGECGAGPLDYANWPDGLSLLFQDDKFAGWGLDGRGDGGITTASGISPGSTRAELEAAYTIDASQTTLGTEFAAGELRGLIEGAGAAAKVSYLWAGVDCAFR